MHDLIAPRTLDPRWFRLMQQGRQEGRAIDSRSIEVHGQVLQLVYPEKITLIPSEKVYVILNRFFYLETEKEQQERQRKAEEERIRNAEETRRRENQYREEAEAFNATLHIPVQWVSGQKDVLSGLSENSYGDGRNKATVDHIMLKKDLQDGRLVRNAGDFLCTSTSGNNGKQWAAQPESVMYDGDNQLYQAKVTCKACLKIAQRWNKQ